MSFRILTNGYP